jgi:hypothetical protein
VFSARYALGPYIKQARFVFKWLNTLVQQISIIVWNSRYSDVQDYELCYYTMLVQCNCFKGISKVPKGNIASFNKTGTEENGIHLTFQDII